MENKEKKVFDIRHKVKMYNAHVRFPKGEERENGAGSILKRWWLRISSSSD